MQLEIDIIKYYQILRYIYPPFNFTTCRQFMIFILILVHAYFPFHSEDSKSIMEFQLALWALNH